MTGIPDKPIRVLVCGGRYFSDAGLLDSTLDGIARDRGISLLIEGGATGADALAWDWATLRGVDVAVYPADWSIHGKSAGPKRNEKMLKEGRPDLVVAFAGGRGTADMVARARAAGVSVVEPRRMGA